MTAGLIDIRTLIASSTGVKSISKFSHKVTKGSLPGFSKTFFNKEMESAGVAQLEVLAQEFFRLIIPSQPETYIAQNPITKTYHILSEEVLGFRQLPNREQNNFLNGTYTGLGQVVLASVFVHEIDLKIGNIGLNQVNRVIKIDGDWCFAGLRNSGFDKKKTITPDLLAKLPFPFGIYAYNWLDLVMQNVPYFSSNIVDVRLAQAPHFRAEINEAILKLLVLPDNYIEQFVDAYIPVGSSADRFINYLIARREELRLVALQNQSFKDYLLTEEPKILVDKHLKHMEHFTANGCYKIINDRDCDGLELDVAQLFNALPVKSKIHTKVENSISRAAKILENLKIDCSRIEGKAGLAAYTLRIKRKIDSLESTISKACKEFSLPLNSDILLKLKEKRGLLKTKVERLMKRFNLLEQVNFDEHLQLFIDKRDQLKKKVSDNPKYQVASNKAEQLCEALEKAKETFLYGSVPLAEARKQLKQDCKLAIDDAKETLIGHREWKGAILKFIIDVISFLTRGLSDSKLGIFAKTDSAKKLEDFEKTLLLSQ